MPDVISVPRLVTSEERRVTVIRTCPSCRQDHYWTLSTEEYDAWLACAPGRLPQTVVFDEYTVQYFTTGECIACLEQRNAPALS